MAQRQHPGTAVAELASPRYSCAAQPLDQAVLQAAYNRTQPFAVVAAAGAGVLDVVPGEPVCVRVVVPPRQWDSVSGRRGRDAAELYHTIATQPSLWDSIMLDAVGVYTGVNVPIRLQPARHASMLGRDTVHVYEGELRAFDEGEFKLTGVLEYREAAWNYEEPVPPPLEYAPEAIATWPGTRVRVMVPEASAFHLQNYKQLPFCNGLSEAGRWLPVATLPFSPQSQGLTVYSGRVWLPYGCRLRGYTYSSFLQCLDDSRPLSSRATGIYTIHWFGDTNTRRALKKITSLGDWCAGEAAQRTSCVCDDSGEVFLRFTGQNTVRDTLLELEEEFGGWSVRENGVSKGRSVPSPQARIYYHRWEGLTKYNGRRWQDTFQPSAMGDNPEANLVIISLGNLDASFTPFLEFTRQLAELAQLIQDTYSDQHIILRTPQYFCCREPRGAPLRRVQRDRNRLYGEYTQQVFEHRFGDRVHVWDVGAIVEALPVAERTAVSSCAVNTVPSEIVDIENQLLISGLCKDDKLDGGAERRLPAATELG
ncbi:hypothetical protein GGF46_005369 [Coemansia sp. RSA 552]|nr:hypothetical protein GGF46_005369 [Coemansia sp. RSA 552]